MSRRSGVMLYAAAVSCALACGSVVRADALPAQLHVRWSAPADCPRDGEFDAELARLLGREARASIQAEVSVQVSELSGDPQRYQLSLHLKTSGQDSERTLALTRCADVRHAAALLIATAFEQPAEPVRAASQAWLVQAGGLVDLSGLPSISGGPQLGAAWSAGALRLTLEARYLLPREVRDGASRLQANLDLVAGSLGVAYLWQLGAVQLGPSLAIELGALRGRASGEQPRSANTLWLSGMLGGLADFAVGQRLGLILALQLCAPLRRPTFSLADEAPFYETSKLGVRASLSARLHFGSTELVRSGQ